MNFLEQLVAEWYAYQGYFVRTNVKIGKKKSGGYEGEMDVVAYDPKEKTLIHIEVSGATSSWKDLEKNFKKKFETAAKYYTETFDFEFKTKKKIAIAGWGKTMKGSIDLGDVELVTIPKLMKHITKKMKELDPMKEVIPEGYPLLRAIQFAVRWLKE